MRDAVSLLGKSIDLGEDRKHVIVDFQFTTKEDLYVTLQKPDNTRVNWRYEDLLVYLTNNFLVMEGYIYESPDRGKTIYRRKFGNYDKREKVEKSMKMMSLYDYLGRAAGKDLGLEVNKAAMAEGIELETRQVSNRADKGPVMLYPEWFLKQYFELPKGYRMADEDELPF